MVHRDTRIFGEDADDFKPERWLSSDSIRISLMNHNYLPVITPEDILLESRDIVPYADIPGD